MNNQQQRDTVKDMMSTDVEVCNPQDSLTDCAQMMRDLDVGALPVCDNGKIVGMVTDRDIVVRAVADGEDTEDCCARDIMSTPPHFCFEDEDFQSIRQTFENKQIRRIMVLNRNKELVGMLSLGDIATQATDKQAAGEVLQQISEPNATKKAA